MNTWHLQVSWEALQGGKLRQTINNLGSSPGSPAAPLFSAAVSADPCALGTGQSVAHSQDLCGHQAEQVQ